MLDKKLKRMLISIHVTKRLKRPRRPRICLSPYCCLLNLLNLWSSSKKKVRILFSSLIGLKSRLTSAKNYSIPILFLFILVGFMIMVSIQVSLGLQKLIKCVPEPIGVCSTIWEFTECRKLFVTKRGTYCVNRILINIS